MNVDKKFNFRTLVEIGVYVIILISSDYLLQNKVNGIGVFILIALVGLIVLVVIHSKRAIYTCTHCNKEFKISAVIDLISPHKMYSKYLKCPNCKTRNWQKEKR